MAKILVHVCCAHCADKLLAGLAAESVSYEPTLYWGNPNVHPLIEWRRRLKAVKMLAERAELELVADETYGLTEFCRAIHGHEAVPARCARCYALRLSRAARVARELGMAVFTSTLATSRHQHHRLIRSAGEKAAAAEGVAFLYRDWREAPENPERVKMLYRQQYCGCVFSEYDRFKDTSTHLWPPPARD
jgi:epoxyqueuosine reductase